MEKEYAGYKIRLNDNMKFEVSDPDGDVLGTRDTYEAATNWINGRFDREVKKTEVKRPNLDLPVLMTFSSSNGNYTEGKVSRTHGGNGNVMVDGQQRGYGSNMYPDTYPIRKLLDRRKALIAEEKNINTILHKLSVPTSVSDWQLKDRSPAGKDAEFKRLYDEAKAKSEDAQLLADVPADG